MASPGSPDVLVNGRPMARAGDAVTCGVGANRIVTGAKLVHVNNKLASRLHEHTVHPGGLVLDGSPDVLIGGDSAGIRVGAEGPDAARECVRAAATRAKRSRVQSNGNCGLEASRQIINRGSNQPVSEALLMRGAIANGWAEDAPRPQDKGATNPIGRESLLDAYGVPSKRETPTPAAIGDALSGGKGVITPHDAGKLWNNEDPGTHAVLVTSARYDANGNIESYFINDTGQGQCWQAVPARQFEGSLRHNEHGAVSMNVTEGRIW